jgi:hypothetical protein
MEEVMLALFDTIYYNLRREEIEKASIRLKRIKIDTILQRVAKLCWKYNIQYEIILKTNEMLIIKLIGNIETVAFKYHKTDMVLRKEVDFFLSKLDEIRASKGVYITTGEFERIEKYRVRNIFSKKDCILENKLAFIKKHLGLRGKAANELKIDRLKFYKYLPV